MIRLLAVAALAFALPMLALDLGAPAAVLGLGALALVPLAAAGVRT